jgi:hypothetical protein
MRLSKVLVFVFLFIFVGNSVALAASDPYYKKQWYLQEIRAEEAWSVSKGSAAIVVAIIDTGVDLDNPDIKDNVWVNADEVAGNGIDDDKNGYVDDRNGWDFVVNSADPNPKLISGYTSAGVSHGTFIAGTVSATHDNNFGIKGITSNVKIMSLVALDTTGKGGSGAVAEAVAYAVDNGADVINLSFGGEDYDLSLKQAISNAYSKGVVVVAAGGNALNGSAGYDLTNNPIYPICYDQEFNENKILGVVALDQDNHIADYSLYGAGCIDIAAPGDNITSLAYQNGNYSQFQSYVNQGWYGSSFASGMVSGAAALLKSVNRNLQAKDIIKIIREESGLLIVSSKYQGKVGEGRLDIKKAVDKVISHYGNYAPSVPASPVVPVTPSVPASPSAPYVPPVSTLSPIVTDAEFYTATRASGSGVIRVFNSQYKQTKQFPVFGDTSFHGLNISLADVNLDGQKDIVAAGVKGDQPFVRVVDTNGTILSSFLAFEPNFFGGSNAAAGDVDGDGQIEIVVVPDSDRSPIVRVYNLEGQLENEFYAYNISYIAGINVAVGDVDGDGLAEIITSPHYGLLPKIKIFNGKGVMEKEIMAYAPNFTGGVNIGLGDMNGDGKLDIITGAGAGGGPHVQSFDYWGNKISSFMAFANNMTAGIYVKSFDWNRDGQNEIVVTAAAPGGPHVKIFSLNGSLMGEFFPYDISFTSGVNVEVK